METIEYILRGIAYLGAIASGLLAVLIFLGKVGLGGYFSKKGENRAMKEDLEKLTRITEGNEVI